MGDVAQLVGHRTGTLPMRVRFPGAARDFFPPRVNFQCRLCYGVRTPPCAFACIYICSHVKDPVVHVRVRWIMETLKTPSMHCRLGSAILSQLAFPGEGNPNFPWEESDWDKTVVKSSKLKKKRKWWNKHDNCKPFCCMNSISVFDEIVMKQPHKNYKYFCCMNSSSVAWIVMEQP